MELFDLTPETDETVASEGTAVQEEGSGENEQTVTESAAGDSHTSEPTTEPTPGQENDHAVKDGVQSKEDNARYAAARRKAEQERDSAIKEVLAAVGMTNPYTGDPIETMDEFRTYKDKLSEERVQGFADRAGMAREEFDQMVQQLPEVVRAKEILQQAEVEREKNFMEKQLAEISKLNPDIKTWEDLGKDPMYAQIREKVKTTKMTPAEAYLLCHHEELMTRAANRAKESRERSDAGRRHMTGVPAVGNGDTAVPPDVRQSYRDFYPDMSDEEILRHYNRDLKRTRKE